MLIVAYVQVTILETKLTSAEGALAAALREAEEFRVQMQVRADAQQKLPGAQACQISLQTDQTTQTDAGHSSSIVAVPVSNHPKASTRPKPAARAATKRQALLRLSRRAIVAISPLTHTAAEVPKEDCRKGRAKKMPIINKHPKAALPAAAQADSPQTPCNAAAQQMLPRESTANCASTVQSEVMAPSRLSSARSSPRAGRGHLPSLLADVDTAMQPLMHHSSLQQASDHDLRQRLATPHTPVQPQYHMCPTPHMQEMLTPQSGGYGHMLRNSWHTPVASPLSHSPWHMPAHSHGRPVSSPPHMQPHAYAQHPDHYLQPTWMQHGDQHAAWPHHNEHTWAANCYSSGQHAHMQHSRPDMQPQHAPMHTHAATSEQPGKWPRPAMPEGAQHSDKAFGSSSELGKESSSETLDSVLSSLRR